MGEFTDSFHPNIQKRYPDFLNELDANHVYRGLLGFGMFANRVPRVLTSEMFLYFCMDNSISTSKKTWCPWISFRYTRDTGSYRNFGIPNPFAYNQLVELIKLYWEEIRNHLVNHSLTFPYVINSVHIRMLHQEEAIFSMNYTNWEEDYNPLPAIAVGKKFTVHCDISQCFPSIYTHAVDWVIRGKKQAKSNHTGNSKQKTWPEKLDQALQSTTNGETHGVLIGPHSSNMVSEILLTPVDETLINEGFRFQRAIDDYTCFVDTYPEAEKFIYSLESELRKYGLSLNQKKTEIKELPKAMVESWVRRLNDFKFSEDPINYKEVRAFIDLAIELMEKEENTQSTMLYALKMINGHVMTKNAERYFCDMTLHLMYIYPYLLPYLEELIPNYSPFSEGNKLQKFFKLIFTDGLNRKDFLTSTFSLYYSMRFNSSFGSLDKNIQEVIDSEDCLLLLFSFLYAQKYAFPEEAPLISEAKKLAGDPIDFGENWIFCYEVLDVNDFPKNVPFADDWKKIKEDGVTFIDYLLI